MLRQRFPQQLALLACLGMILPPHAMAADPGDQPALVTRDVALQANHVLVGRFVDVEGRAIDGATVTLHQGQQAIAQTTTDVSGVYQFVNMRSGQYEIAAGNTSQSFRVWTMQSAPPAAQPYATVVNPTAVVRGQSCCPNCDDSNCSGCNGHSRGLRFGRTTVIGGVALAAVLVGGIIWYVVDENDDDDVPAPVSP